LESFYRNTRIESRVWNHFIGKPELKAVWNHFIGKPELKAEFGIIL
jgi:hypothetical protein